MRTLCARRAGGVLVSDQKNEPNPTCFAYTSDTPTQKMIRTPNTVANTARKPTPTKKKEMRSRQIRLQMHRTAASGPIRQNPTPLTKQ